MRMRTARRVPRWSSAGGGLGARGRRRDAGAALPHRRRRVGPAGRGSRRPAAPDRPMRRSGPRRAAHREALLDGDDRRAVRGDAPPRPDLVARKVWTSPPPGNCSRRRRARQWGQSARSPTQPLRCTTARHLTRGRRTCSARATGLGVDRLGVGRRRLAHGGRRSAGSGAAVVGADRRQDDVVEVLPQFGVRHRAQHFDRRSRFRSIRSALPM